MFCEKPINISALLLHVIDECEVCAGFFRRPCVVAAEVLAGYVTTVKCLCETQKVGRRWFSVSSNENTVVVRRMFEAINKQDLATVGELMSTDLVMIMNGQQKLGWEANKQFLRDEFRAFPDLHVTIEDAVAEGDRVCVRLKETATHKGEYRGLAPTGNKLSYSVAAFWRLSEGKIAEGWVVYDELDFLGQLGFVNFQGFPDEK